VANERIWAPWRLAYVKDASKDAEEECIFCAKPRESDDEHNLIVHRRERCFVILNRFPYTNGHLMVAPYEHLATLPEVPAGTMGELMELTQRGITALEHAYSRMASTSAATRAAWRAPASSTTSTCTWCRAGAATPTSCRCSPTPG